MIRASARCGRGLRIRLLFFSFWLVGFLYIAMRLAIFFLIYFEGAYRKRRLSRDRHFPALPTLHGGASHPQPRRNLGLCPKIATSGFVVGCGHFKRCSLAVVRRSHSRHRGLRVFLVLWLAFLPSAQRRLFAWTRMSRRNLFLWSLEFLRCRFSFCVFGFCQRLDCC